MACSYLDDFWEMSRTNIVKYQILQERYFALRARHVAAKAVYDEARGNMTYAGAARRVEALSNFNRTKEDMIKASVEVFECERELIINKNRIVLCVNRVPLQTRILCQQRGSRPFGNPALDHLLQQFILLVEEGTTT